MFGILKPRIELELDEGEEQLYYTRRHWILLLMRIGTPLVIALATLLLAFYRAIGGLFFVFMPDMGTDLNPALIDIPNIAYVIVIAALLYWWSRRSSAKGRKPSLSTRAADLLILLAAGVIALVIYFRYRGGRVFLIDSGYARGTDLLNLVLLLVMLIAVGVIVYLLIDWANDYLVLTNVRVIYDDTQLLVRHVQQDIQIDNIQQVSLSAESYFAYFLGQLALWRDQLLHSLRLRRAPPPEKVAVAYGKLVIGSLSARRLVFDWAYNPAEMQQRINGELSKLRKRQEPELLRQIIDDQIYGHKPAPKTNTPIQVVEREGPLPWLFHKNPEINYAKEEIVWRPYWIFLALAMFPAIAALILVTILLVVVTRLELIGGGLALLVWLPVALVCIGRIIWVREEHENDKYILQREKIIDVDKKPFGPESSRSAPLNNIQDISFDVSFVESILGYGDVTILTGGSGAKFTFKHVPDPRGVQATINDYLTDFKKREKARAQQATLDLLKQYHALQLDHDELIASDQLQSVAEKVKEYLVADTQDQVEREITARLPEAVQRQVNGTLRRELLRGTFFRRRRAP